MGLCGGLGGWAFATVWDNAEEFLKLGRKLPFRSLATVSGHCHSFMGTSDGSFRPHICNISSDAAEYLRTLKWRFRIKLIVQYGEFLPMWAHNWIIV